MSAVGPILRIGFTIALCFAIAASFTIGIVGLYELCPKPCNEDGACPACDNIGDVNLKVIIPFGFSLLLAIYGFFASCMGMCVSDRIEKSRYNSSCCGDNLSINDKECLFGWGIANVIGCGLIVFIDAITTLAFYVSNSTWNYAALGWMMFSTHAMAVSMFLSLWMPYPRCGRKKEYEEIPTVSETN